MNEEYLKGLHGHLSIKEDFGTWVSSVKDNDEYLQGLHGHLGIESDYNTWKSSVWGSGEPQEVDTPAEPKGETAEVSGDSVSTSASTETSSSESETTPKYRLPTQEEMEKAYDDSFVEIEGGVKIPKGNIIDLDKERARSTQTIEDLTDDLDKKEELAQYKERMKLVGVDSNEKETLGLKNYYEDAGVKYSTDFTEMFKQSSDIAISNAKTSTEVEEEDPFKNYEQYRDTDLNELGVAKVFNPETELGDVTDMEDFQKFLVKSGYASRFDREIAPYVDTEDYLESDGDTQVQGYKHKILSEYFNDKRLNTLRDMEILNSRQKVNGEDYSESLQALAQKANTETEMLLGQINKFTDLKVRYDKNKAKQSEWEAYLRGDDFDLGKELDYYGSTAWNSVSKILLGTVGSTLDIIGDVVENPMGMPSSEVDKGYNIFHSSADATDTIFDMISVDMPQLQKVWLTYKPVEVGGQKYEVDTDTNNIYKDGVLVSDIDPELAQSIIKESRGVEETDYTISGRPTISGSMDMITQLYMMVRTAKALPVKNYSAAAGFAGVLQTHHDTYTDVRKQLQDAVASGELDIPESDIDGLAKMNAYMNDVVVFSAGMFSPNRPLAGKISPTEMVKNLYQKEVGMTAKKRLGNYFGGVMKESLKEVVQEETELIAQKQINGLTNFVAGNSLLDTELRKSEIAETALVTMLGTGTSTGFSTRRNLVGNQSLELYKTAKELAKLDTPSIEKAVNNAVSSGDISREQGEAIFSTMVNIGKFDSKIPNTITKEDVRMQLLPLLEQREKLANEEKQADPAFKDFYKGKQEELSNKINAVVRQGEIESEYIVEDELGALELELEEAKDEETKAEIREDIALLKSNPVKYFEQAGQDAEGTDFADSFTDRAAILTDTANEKQATESETIASTNNQQAEAQTEQPTVQTEGEEEVSIKDIEKIDLSETLGINKTIEILDSFDKKLKKFGDETLGINLPVTVARVGLKAMKTAAQTSKLAGDVVSAGVNAIMETQWYRDLKQSEKSDFHKKGLMAYFDEMETTMRKGSQPTTKANREFRNKVKDVTGQTDTSDKVVTTKAKALKEQLKNVARGAKEGSKAMKDAKTAFIKNISKEIKRAVDTKDLTKSEATRILSAVNQLDHKNYDKVKPLVDKVIASMESRGLRNSIKGTKSKVRRAAKSQRTPANIRTIAQDAVKIPEKYLNDSDKKKYQKALEELQAATKASSNKGYKMANAEKLTETLNTLMENAEKNRLSALVEAAGLEGTTLTNSEIEALLEADNVDEYIDNLKEAKRKEARLLLEKQASYAAMALLDVDNTNLSDDEKKFVRELKNVDFTLMSSTDIRDYIKAVDNIAENGSFASAYDVISKAKAYKNVQEALNTFSKEELGFLRSDTVSKMTNFKTLSLMFKTVFKNGQKSAKFNRQSGLNALSMAYTKHRQEMTKLSEAYDNLIKKIAKSKNKQIKRSENTALRGVVGQLIQGSTEEDFDINRSRLEDHIKNLKKSGGVDANRAAERLQEIYDQFKDMKSQDEVIDYVKGLNDGNWDLIQFWLDHYASLKDDLKYNTEVVHNQGFDEVVGNYLPIKLKQDGTPIPEEDGEKAFYNSNGIKTTKPSPTTIKRTKTKKLPQGRMLDLDFDAVMFNRANRVGIDLNTSKQHKDVVNFFKSPQMYDIFHKEVVDAFNDRVNRMRDVQLGISGISSNDAVMKSAAKLERTLKTLGTTMALGSLTQYPKQYVSVAVNVMSRLGSNAGLMMEAMFTNKSDIPLLDMVSVSMRGETQGGTVTAATRISEEEKRQTMKMASHIARATGEKMSNVRDLLFTSLRKGDVNVAKSSWVAFYKEYLVKNGVNKRDIDMKTEHELMDTKLRQDAISYAELMVEETQIASDESRGSEFYQSQDTWKSILRGIFLPYQSFNINSKMRMLTDIGILMNQNKNNTREEKSEAIKSLIGTTAEVVAFQTMKVYILGGLYSLGKVAIEELFDLEAPEEDEEAEKDFKFKKWYSALIKDLNPLSIGAFAEDLSIEMLNYIHYMTSAEEEEDLYDFQKRLKEEEGGNLFYRYGDQKGFDVNPMNSGGLYQIPFQQAGQVIDDFKVTFEGSERDRYGNIQEYDFTDEQLAFMKFSFAVDLISALGLGEADTRRIINKVKREQKKLAK